MSAIWNENTSLSGGKRMFLRHKPVSIRQLPERLDRKQERLFLQQLDQHLNVVRPAIVIDCSLVREMDLTAIHLLLRSLERTMKHNGDIRLAGVSPASLLQLERAGADRIFRIFRSTEEAEESFQHRIPFSASHAPLRESLSQEYAA